MLTKKNHHQPLKPVINERRAGIDRRVLTYDWYIPERRTTTDRRQGQCEDDSHGEWRDRRRYA